MSEEIASIKKPGKVEYISKEEYLFRVKEIAKCKKSITYFASNYFKIVNLDTGLTTINLYPKQRELLEFLCNEDRGVLLAARQSSKTTTYTIFALWYTMFFPEKKIMILCNKASVMTEVLSRIQLAYQYLPSFLKSAVVTWNKTEVEFANHSSIKGFPASSDAARGFSANCVFWDEAAFTPNNLADKIFTSIYPVISTSKSSKFFMISTSNGVDSKQIYYDTYMKAKRRDNKEGWKLFEFYWYDVPMRDQAWKEKTIASIGERRFAQEFNNEFLESSTTKKLIPDDIIEKYRIRLSENKTQNYNQGKDLPLTSMDGSKNYVFRMYHDFDPSRTYLATFDCAEGIQKDSSVLYIWDVTDLSKIKMCLKFSANDVSILEFAYLTKELLKLYNNPYLAGESNGISLGYIEQLRVTYQYENFVRMNKDGGCGIDSHVQKKTKACLWTRDMMTTMGFDFDIYDKDLIDEMSTFVKKDTAKIHEIFAAMGDNHDDHIMCLVWMCWILNPENVEHYFDVKDTFQSSLGVVYPKTLAPLFEYLPSEVESIFNDPNVKAFQYYKMENNSLKLTNEGRILSNEEKIKLLQKNQAKTEEPQREIITMGQIEEGYRKKEQASRLNPNNSSGGYFASVGGVDFSNGEQNAEWTMGYSNNTGFDSIFSDDNDDGWSGPVW